MSNTDILFQKFVEQFGVEGIPNVVRSGKSYYYAEHPLITMREHITRDVYSMGLYLGEEKVGFNASPALIDMIAKLPSAQKRKVFVNKKAEWMFLCGRNVLSDSIIKNPHRLDEGIVLVQNERDENLGFGMFKKEDTLIIKHILDKGKYLRMNEKGRKH